MSELIDAQKQNRNVRRTLLADASVLVLLGYLSTSPSVLAQSSNSRPTVWIELGGELEKVEGEHPVFAPEFFNLASPAVTDGLIDAQRPYRYGTGLEGKFSVAPKDSNWVFSAGIRYGRANSTKHSHYQTPGQPSIYPSGYGQPLPPIKPNHRIFGDSQTGFSETHLILDFQVGKEVGLGRLGASSMLNFGVRYAQFTSRSDIGLNAEPVYGHITQFGYGTGFLGKYGKFVFAHHQTYTAVLHNIRNTKAIGPSVSWDGSLPIAGREDEATVDLDWGVNAAMLFGKQRTEVSHQTTGYYLGHVPTYTDSTGKVRVKNNLGAGNIVRTYIHSTSHTRSRSVTIPNVGGFAGVSLHFPNAKVSLGYRADFFFNASDQGIDVRDAANRNFYGPFATISIGLGG